MSEQNNNSNTISKSNRLQNLFIALSMVVATVLSLYYTMDHYSDGGCDGGLCGLLLIFHAVPLLAAWVFTLLAFATVKASRIASMGLLIIGLLITIVILCMDYGYQLDELKEPCLLLFIAQGYIFFQWQSNAPKHLENTPTKDTD